VQGLQNILIRKSRTFRIIKSHPKDIRYEPVVFN
jgi:hypothetical protein